MGAITTINTYACIANELQLDQLLKRFANLLQEIGYQSGNVDQSIRMYTWHDLWVENLGISFPSRPINFNGTELSVVPAMAGFTQLTAPALANPLIELQLQFQEEKLVDQHGWYRTEIAAAIWTSMLLFNGAFPEAQIYLSPEGCDGDQWQVLLAGASNRSLWSFDLALIPTEQRHYFSIVPASHYEAAVPKGIVFARVGLWPCAPWK